MIEKQPRLQNEDRGFILIFPDMKNNFRTHNIHHCIAVGLWLIIFGVYLQTIAPAVNFIDSGELATVACTLSIAHPTGYPLFTLLGRVFSLLPIAREEIVRLNSMSALFTSLAAVVLYYIVRLLFRWDKKTGDAFSVTGASLFAVCVLAFSQTFWSQAVTVEVYSLHLLLISMIIYFFLKANLDEKENDWLMFAFVLGLSFSNHLTTIFLAPAFLFLFFKTQGFTKASFRKIATLVVPFLLGLSVYIFLPVRASASPLLNWGNPSTVENFFNHVSAKQFRVWMFSSTEIASRQFTYFIERLSSEFHWTFLPFPILGAWRLLTRQRTLCVFLFLLLAGCVAYAINYDIHDIDSYFLLAFIALALFSAFGVSEILGWIRYDNIRKGIFFLFLSTVVFEVIKNWKDVDESKNYVVENYTKTILTNVPQHSILLSFQWDYLISASYYLQNIKHFRPDIVIIDKELLRRSWYFEQLKNFYPNIIAKSQTEIDSFLKELYKFEHGLPYNPSVIEGKYIQMINSFIEHNIDSVNIYVTSEIEQNIAHNFLRVPTGFAYLLTKDTSYHAQTFPAIVFQDFEGSNTYSVSLCTIISSMLVQRGMYESFFKNDSFALKYFEIANTINPTLQSAQAINFLKQKK